MRTIISVTLLLLGMFNYVSAENRFDKSSQIVITNMEREAELKNMAEDLSQINCRFKNHLFLAEHSSVVFLEEQEKLYKEYKSLEERLGKSVSQPDEMTTEEKLSILGGRISLLENEIDRLKRKK